jgi:C-terminal processing protease CtpA/Prc
MTRRGAGWISVGVAIACALSSAACLTREGTIGAMLGQRGDGRLFVRETPPALAASKHGLSEGDEILLIDGRDVRAMDELELHRALSGDAGSRVKITAVRGDEVVRVTLARSQVPAKRPPAH